MSQDLALPKPRALRAGDDAFDARARADLKHCLRRIDSHRQKADLAYWVEGDAFVHIRDHKLYLQDGYHSMSDWIARHLRRSRSHVAARMQFASAFTRAETLQFGVERLKLALRYASLTVPRGDVWTAARLSVVVPVDADHVRTVRFADASPAELEAAVAHQQALAALRTQHALEARPLVTSLVEAVKLDDGRALARVHARPPPNGLVDDTVLAFELRAGDLVSTLERLLAAARPPPGKRARNH